LSSMLNGNSELLQMKCPSCGLELGDFPTLENTSIQCPRCEYKISWDGACWDACVDRTYPRDFARQWVLWEAGKLGDSNLVYGNDPKNCFSEFLRHTSLTEEDLASKKILEIGFGHGRLLQQLQRCSPTAYGVDLSRPLASARLHPGSAFLGNLFNIPFVPRQFGLVICRGVIHCTPDPQRAFACLADQVADGGMLYLAGLYEPGKGNLILRTIFPRVWSYPESIRLGLASLSSVLRAALECFRKRTIGFSAFKAHYKHYKLDMFDVISPRWTSVHEGTEVLGWFKSHGFLAHRIGCGDYVGVKADQC
jgi:SAM-dependent methyltransferase